MRTTAQLMILALALIGVGCGDGTSGSGGAGGTTSSGGAGGVTSSGGGGQGGTGGAMPGTIEVTVEGITDQAQGLVVLGLTKSPVLNAAFCEPVGAAPFDHTELFHPHTDMDPCTEDPSAQSFPAGEYNLAVGTIVGGTKEFLHCAALVVTVDGDQKVTAPPFAEWKAPPFDAMDVCNLQ